jgi:hypothetical protein
LVTKFVISHNQIRTTLLPGGQMPSGVGGVCATCNADRWYPDLGRASSGQDSSRDSERWAERIKREYLAYSTIIASDGAEGSER